MDGFNQTLTSIYTNWFPANNVLLLVENLADSGISSVFFNDLQMLEVSWLIRREKEDKSIAPISRWQLCSE